MRKTCEQKSAFPRLASFRGKDQAAHCCFYELGGPFVGALVMRALLLGVYTGALAFSNSHTGCGASGTELRAESVDRSAILLLPLA